MIDLQQLTSFEAELRCLGFLNSNRKFIEQFDYDRFYFSHSKTLWDTLNAGKDVTLSSTLKSLGMPLELLRWLSDGFLMTESDYKLAKRQVYDLHFRRNLVEENLRNIQDAMDLTSNLKEVDEGVKIYGIEERLQAGRGSALARLSSGGITFGLRLLDDIFGGCKMGQVITLVAPNGCFKTSLAMNMMQRATQHNEGLNSMFFSFEMGDDDYSSRESLIELEKGSLEKLEKDVFLNDTNYEMAKQFLVNTHLKRMYTVFSPLSVSQIRRTIKEFEAKNGKIQLICIDYLDFIERDGKRKDASWVADTMNGIKQLAKELEFVAIVLTQVDKSSVKTSYDQAGNKIHKRINRFDALGGQGISNASDFVICLWRESEGVVGCVDKARSPYKEGINPNPDFLCEIDYANFKFVQLIELEEE